MLVYLISTDLIHTNPTCHAQYVREEKNSFWFDSGPRVPGSARVLSAAAFAYMMLAEAFAKIVEFDISNALQLALREFETAFRGPKSPDS